MPCVVLGVRVKRLPGAPIPAVGHKRAREGMLSKPPECRGCPAYGDGQGFVPDELKHGAPVTVIAQGPGADEEAGRRYLGSNQWEPHPQAPMIGKTGRVFERTFLPLAGLDRSEVSLGNIVRCRWNHKDTLPPLNQKVVQAAIAHCSRAHLRIPESTKVVVAMGEFAFYGLTGLLHDFNGWRGYLAPLSLPGEPRVPMTGVWTPGRTPGDRLPVFVTYHIARLFREPEAELPTKRDWNKLAYILAGKWPEPMSPIETNPENLRWMQGSAFDTEFHEDTRQLVRFSVANPDRTVFVIEWADMIRWRGGDQATLQRILPKTAPPDTVHAVWPASHPHGQEAGALSDLLPQGFRGVVTPPQGQTTMRPHAEVQESLVSPMLQAHAQETGIHAPSLEDRAHLYPVPGYGSVPVVSLLGLQHEESVGPGPRPQDWQGTGATLFAVQSRHWLTGGQLDLAHYSGLIPLRLVGHNVVVDIPYLGVILPPGTVFDADCSMNTHSCLWSGRTGSEDEKGKTRGGASSHTLNFLGSIYARINRWKHLSRIAPRQYAGGDALGTMDAWATGLHGGLLGELDRDPQTKWVYEHLQKPLIPIIMKAHRRGIATDREAAKVALADIKREQDRFELRAQAYAGWALNLRSPQHVAFWLYTIEQIKARRAR